MTCSLTLASKIHLQSTCMYRWSRFLGVLFKHLMYWHLLSSIHMSIINGSTSKVCKTFLPWLRITPLYYLYLTYLTPICLLLLLVTFMSRIIILHSVIGTLRHQVDFVYNSCKLWDHGLPSSSVLYPINLTLIMVQLVCSPHGLSVCMMAFTCEEERILGSGTTHYILNCCFFLSHAPLIIIIVNFCPWFLIYEF